MLPTLERLTRSPYFDTYLNHLTSDDLLLVLNQSSLEINELLQNLEEDKLNFKYADGKWTIKELIHHVIETELIFNYRALRIAREDDAQILAGFDENEYVFKSKLDGFSKQDLLEYFNAVRKSTIFLFKSMSTNQLTKIGTASGWEIQVEALFYITAGHTLHHVKVLKERYLEL